MCADPSQKQFLERRKKKTFTLIPLYFSFFFLLLQDVKPNGIQPATKQPGQWIYIYIYIL